MEDFKFMVRLLAAIQAQELKELAGKTAAAIITNQINGML